MLILIDDVDHFVTIRTASLLERFLVHVRARKLDRELACDASPDASVPLALRAQALVRPARRRMLAQRVKQLVVDATRPAPHPATARVPIRREKVIDATDALLVLVDCLLRQGPVPARGVAQVQILLTDGSGPVFYPGSTDDLRSSVLQAVEALDTLI